MADIDLVSRITNAINSLPRSVLADGKGGKVGLILGSGLGEVAQGILAEAIVPTKDIDGLVPSTAPTHVGQMIYGTLHGVPVIASQGRVHLYEGYSALDVVMPVYLMGALGVETLIITNAAGGLNPDYEPGDIAMIRDHINLTGANPLIGIDAPEIGVRFADMSQAYDKELRQLVNSKLGKNLDEGIYVGVTGPSLETSAERRYFRQSGGDMVGMSTVLETIAANHCGMRVLGLSVITNKATGSEDQQPDTLEEVIAYAKKGGEQIDEVLQIVLGDIG